MPSDRITTTYLELIRGIVHPGRQSDCNETEGAICILTRSDFSMRALLIPLIFPGLPTLICAEAMASSFAISLERPTDAIDRFHIDNNTCELPNCDYPVRRIRLLSHSHVAEFIAVAHALDSIQITDVENSRASFANITTDAGGQVDVVATTDGPVHLEGHPGVASAGRLHLDSVTILDLWVSPFSYDSTTDRLWFYTDFVLDIDGADAELILRVQCHAMLSTLHLTSKCRLRIRIPLRSSQDSIVNRPRILRNTL
jgi:hypothetical protein